jgi:hypothetical protein
VCCRINLYGDQGAAYGGAEVAEFGALLTCPLGPIPLAARGLAAVLARAGPAGARGHRQPRAAAQPLSNWCAQVALPLIRPGIFHVAMTVSMALRVAPRWPAATIDPAIAMRWAARTRSRQGTRRST